MTLKLRHTARPKPRQWWFASCDHPSGCKTVHQVKHEGELVAIATLKAHAKWGEVGGQWLCPIHFKQVASEQAKRAQHARNQAVLAMDKLP